MHMIVLTLKLNEALKTERETISYKNRIAGIQIGAFHDEHAGVIQGSYLQMEQTGLHFPISCSDRRIFSHKRHDNDTICANLILKVFSAFLFNTRKII